ncbi:LANO_0C00826g1_1 [Lachancea nothofagi CBS 11611]|uniref:LANO_0C00826g1_1 n=1 Tax=Lachancea nothofagi CBS 11611 TaxID=1266666 RepID=A0A1G4J3Q9_9SACH|nr:LANO_0C00826g1_1 [Lachancea nothofagi CBS 11611]
MDGSNTVIRKQNKQDSPLNAQIGRRNRISFVCQACRRGKTKCDREKPHCSRCLKHGIDCVYDVERQTPPKHPNKDAAIARLKRDIEYWQTRALSHTLTGEMQTREHTTENPNVASFPMTSNSSSMSPDDSIRPLYAKNLHDVQIDLRKFLPNLIITQNTSRDVKPSSDMAQVRQDSFLALFFASFFAAASENTLINSISSNNGVPYAKRLNLRSDLMNLQERMLKKCTNAVQQARVTSFSERIMQELGGSRDVRTGIFLNLLNSKMSRNLIEDVSADENVYSAALSELISRLEELLPPLPALTAYKAHFFHCIFPHVPFLDRGMFEEALHNVIISDPGNSQKVKLRLGKQNLRQKIENIAILMVTIGISYNSMKFELGLSSTLKPTDFETLADQALIDQHPITDETILVSQQCIAALDFLNSTTENTICCLLYLWTFYAFSPEEGDFYYGQPTEFVLGMTSILATNIGLHRDPLQFRQFQENSKVDKRIINYRRMLWLGLGTILNSESALKGRCPQSMRDSICVYSPSTNESAQAYMRRMMEDAVGEDEIQKKLYAGTFQKRETYALLSCFEKLWSSPEAVVSLYSLKELMLKVEDHVDKHFPIAAIESNSNSGFECQRPNNEIEKQALFAKATGRASNFQAYIIAQLILLRTSFSVFLYFEMKCKDTYNEFYPYYESFFIDVVQRFLKLTKVYCQYYNGEFASNFSPSTAFIIDKAMQMSMGTIFYTAVAIVLRLTHAIDTLQNNIGNERYFHSRGADDQLSELSRKLELLNSLNNDFERILDRLCHLSTNHLRLTFFSAFKMLLFFDHILQLVKKKELLKTMRQLSHLDLTEKTKNNLFLGFGFDVNRTNEMFHDLKNTVSLSMFNSERLQEIQQVIDHMGILEARVKGPNHKKSNTSVPNGLLDPNNRAQGPNHVHISSGSELREQGGYTDGMNLPFNSELDFNHIELFDFDFDFLLGGM